MKKKLLFVPGYFASTLIDRKTKETRWVRISDFLSNVYDLRMTETYSNLPKVNDLVDDKILYKVKVIPKIVEIESYDKTIKNLKKFCDQTHRELHTVTYDWRDDFIVSIKKIAKKIDELTLDGSKIDVVAHSNGGILMTYYLRYGISDFLTPTESWIGLTKIDSISIVASPLRGAFSLFKHIKDGTPLLRNKKLMGSLDYTSFCSTYFFMPHKNYQKAYLLKKGDATIDLNLFDYKVWKENQWGPYIEKHFKEIPVNDEKFQQVLKRAEAYQHLMLAPVHSVPKNDLKIQIVSAFGRPTYFYPTFKSKNDLKNYSYPKHDKLNGDGVVSFESSRPLEWFNHFHLNHVELAAEHLKVISEYKYQKHIHDFLRM